MLTAQQFGENSKQDWNSLLGEFQFYNAYSKFNEDLVYVSNDKKIKSGRRETWKETVKRTVDFLKEIARKQKANAISKETWERLHTAILEKRVIPSMRLLAMAGPAARRNNLLIYNCSALATESITDFVEAMTLSINGVGVGFSVEREFVDQLPEIKALDLTNKMPTFFVIPDTSEGWSEALQVGLEHWTTGSDVVFVYDKIRKAGARLRTKTGFASGPAPLRYMLDEIRRIVLSAAGRKLKPIECYDIFTLIANCIVSGGVRRSAMICLFDITDEEMLHAKDIENCHEKGQTLPDGSIATENKNIWRWNANNSAVWDEHTTEEQIRHAVHVLIKSGTGEPGIFNRVAANEHIPLRRKEFNKFEYVKYETNPCGEVILKKNQLCNLSAAVVRPDDTLETMLEKIELATILGTIQSCATYFPGMREDWQKNCVEERLLGVDITGQMDNPALFTVENLEKFKELAVETNKICAQSLGINQSTAVTCVKPSGNSSVILDAASGLHTRWDKFYIRNVRVNRNGSLGRVVVSSNYPFVQPENGQTWENATTLVVGFPVKSPDNALTRHDLSAIEQCEWWKKVKIHYTEHNPSVSIYYGPEEADDVENWIVTNRDIIVGMAFFPRWESTLATAAIVSIDEQKYNEMVTQLPERLKFENILDLETAEFNDAVAAQTLSCSAKGSCEF